MSFYNKFIPQRYRIKSQSAEADIRTEPWLMRSEWQSSRLRGKGVGGMVFEGLFGLGWLVTCGFILWDDWPQISANPTVGDSLLFLFPLVGFFIFGIFLKKYWEYRRFGKAILCMDPFPGSIGGQVGGVVELPEGFSSDTVFNVRLNNVYSFVTFNGKSRRRHERVLWSKGCTADVSENAGATILRFLFDVPEDKDIQPAQAVRATNYYKWDLYVTADIPGIDLNRRFDIPVYRTAQAALNISAKVQDNIRKQDRLKYKKTLPDVLPFRSGISGPELYYPPFRYRKSGSFMALVGATFMAAAVFMWEVEQDFSAFVLAGVLGIAGLISGLTMLTKTLYVKRQGMKLVSCARYFGIIKRCHEMRLEDVAHIRYEKTLQTGQKHNVKFYYKIMLYDHYGGKMRVAEGIEGEVQAKLAVTEIARVFNLK